MPMAAHWPRPAPVPGNIPPAAGVGVTRPTASAWNGGSECELAARQMLLRVSMGSLRNHPRNASARQRQRQCAAYALFRARTIAGAMAQCNQQRVSCFDKRSRLSASNRAKIASSSTSAGTGSSQPYAAQTARSRVAWAFWSQVGRRPCAAARSSPECPLPDQIRTLGLDGPHGATN